MDEIEVIVGLGTETFYLRGHFLCWRVAMSGSLTMPRNSKPDIAIYLLYTKYQRRKGDLSFSGYLHCLKALI